MPDYATPPEFEIASLKKQQETVHDLMRPGNGTPWEDRGALGLFTAFFRTCWRSLTRHRLLLDHIRRPETTHEATLFAIGCGVLWAVSVAIFDLIRYQMFVAHPERWDVDGRQYLIESAVQVVLAGALVPVLLRICAGVYNKLIAGGSRNNHVPTVLVYNVFAYSLGPSLLALVPVLGWVLAVIWILADLVIAGTSRLYLRTRDAVINACLVVGVAALISGGLWVACWLLWGKLLSSDPSVVEHAPPSVPQGVVPPR